MKFVANIALMDDPGNRGDRMYRTYSVAIQSNVGLSVRIRVSLFAP